MSSHSQTKSRLEVGSYSPSHCQTTKIHQSHSRTIQRMWRCHSLPRTCLHAPSSDRGLMGEPWHSQGPSPPKRAALSWLRRGHPYRARQPREIFRARGSVEPSLYPQDRTIRESYSRWESRA
jgi:hypothetical protein